MVRQSNSLHDIDAVVVEHDVGFGDQIVQHRLTLRMFEIDCKGTLVTVEFQKTRRHIWVFAGAEKTKRIHATFAGFDFDHVGAQFGQYRGAVRPREHVIEANDTHAVEGTVTASCIESILPIAFCVISTPSAMLRTGSGRNLGSLTFVRDDNAVSGAGQRSRGMPAIE